MPAQGRSGTAAIVIGRNEGVRLLRCLASLAQETDRMVYVDSGSTDGSVAAAQAAGAAVVELDLSTPFTAARARNAGFAHLAREGLPPFVQFIDGDCEMLAGWIPMAEAFMHSHPRAAAVAGRLRERHPDATLYHRLAEAEWNRPPGRTEATGGIAMMRTGAFAEAGGFNPALIAGEEPELCLRLRRAGWEIWQLADDMALHDIGMTRFSQWWTRARRCGYAYAEGATLHGSASERHYVREVSRALIWGLGIPLVTFLGALITPWALMLLLIWPLQVVRLHAKGYDRVQAVFLTLCKLPEAQGALLYFWRRLRRARSTLIEYK